MDIAENLQRVVITLDNIKTDNRDGNWDRLLGCRQVLLACIQELTKEGDADVPDQ